MLGSLLRNLGDGLLFEKFIGSGRYGASEQSGFGDWRAIFIRMIFVDSSSGDTFSVLESQIRSL